MEQPVSPRGLCLGCPSFAWSRLTRGLLALVFSVSRQVSGFWKSCRPEWTRVPVDLPRRTRTAAHALRRSLFVHFTVAAPAILQSDQRRSGGCPHAPNLRQHSPPQGGYEGPYRRIGCRCSQSGLFACLDS